jgi:hypothetical protein
MTDLAKLKYVLLGIGITLFFLSAVVYTLQNSKMTVKYDCRMLLGGWHPDVPIKVQEECRKLIAKTI